MLLLNLLIVFAILIAISALLSGLRIAIQRFFDIYFESKMFFLYWLYYTILILAFLVLISASAFSFGTIIPFLAVFLVLYVAILEYFIIYKRYFDFEPLNKYIFFVVISYFLNALLLVLITNLLLTLLAILFL